MDGVAKLSWKQVTLVSLGAFLAAFLGFVAATRFVRWGPREPGSRLETGQTLPDPVFTGLDGRRVAFSSLAAGKKTLLVLLAADCGFCGLLTSRLNEDYPALGTDYRLVAVFGDPLPKLARYQEEKSLSFPLYSDSPGKFIDEAGIQGYPTLIGVQANGTIAFVEFGYRADRRLEDYLKRL